MPRILFLASHSAPARNDNHLRLPRAFAALGWQTVAADHDDLRWDHGRMLVGTGDIGGYDLIWLLGFGRRESYYDRMQLLRRLDQRRFVNAVDAYTYLHGKLPMAPVLAEHLPESYAAATAEFLFERLDNRTPWILKPSGASFGRDVSLLRNDAEGRQAIQRLIERDGFAVLQRYVPAVEQGEVRCILAGGEVVACYKRLPSPTDMRTNLATGGKPVRHALSGAERLLAEKIARWLVGTGVGFAAADIAFPYLIEINIANPGGLATLETLTGADPAPRVAKAIARRVGDGKAAAVERRQTPVG